MSIDTYILKFKVPKKGGKGYFTLKELTPKTLEGRLLLSQFESCYNVIYNNTLDSKTNLLSDTLELHVQRRQEPIDTFKFFKQIDDYYGDSLYCYTRIENQYMVYRFANARYVEMWGNLNPEIDIPYIIKTGPLKSLKRIDFNSSEKESKLQGNKLLFKLCNNMFLEDDYSPKIYSYESKLKLYNKFTFKNKIIEKCGNRTYFPLDRLFSIEEVTFKNDINNLKYFKVNNKLFSVGSAVIEFLDDFILRNPSSFVINEYRTIDLNFILSLNRIPEQYFTYFIPFTVENSESMVLLASGEENIKQYLDSNYKTDEVICNITLKNNLKGVWVNERGETISEYNPNEDPEFVDKWVLSKDDSYGGFIEDLYFSKYPFTN